jgi:hypothetical protein
LSLRSIVLLCCLVLLGLAAGCSGGSPKADGTAPPPSQTAARSTTAARNEHWREDLRYLAQQLGEKHPNAFSTVSHDTFDQAVRQLDAAIPSLTDDAVVLGLARLVASIGDSHTVLPIIQPGTAFHFYPLQLRWMPGGLYVIAARPQDRDAIGKRVVAIGGRRAEDVLASIAPFVSHDNDQWLLAQSPGYLQTAEVLRAAGIEPDAKHGQFRLESTGTQTTLELDAIESSAIGRMVAGPNVSTPLYEQQPGKTYWYQYLADQRTLYVQYNRAADDPAQPFAQFASEVLGVADSRRVDRFVLDVRGNGGGDSRIIQPLITGLAARPALSTRGHLFVLVGRQTFSSGLLAVTDLRRATSPIVLGEPTGGRPNSYGEVLTFTLPNSGLNVTYSTRYFKTQDQDTPSLLPDVTIPISAEDFFAGRDPVLDAALAYRLP